MECLMRAMRPERVTEQGEKRREQYVVCRSEGLFWEQHQLGEKIPFVLHRIVSITSMTMKQKLTSLMKRWKS